MNLSQNIQIYKVENGSNIQLKRQLFINGMMIITLKTFSKNLQLILKKKF